MSKKNKDNKDIKDLREFEEEVSKTGNIGSGTRHASYFIVINENAEVVKGDINGFFNELPNYVKKKLNVEFFAYNMERNKKGNLHIHLYIELADNGIRWKTMQNNFPGAHIEIRRGSPKQALLYLEKPPGVTFGGVEKHHTVVIPVQTVGDFGPYELIQYRRKSPTSKMTEQQKYDYFMENCTDRSEIKKQDIRFATVHRQALEEAFEEKKLEAFINSDCVKTFTNPNGDKCYTVDRLVYYLWGTSRVGKTYGVQRKHGEANVSPITDLHKDMKFDDYHSTPVMTLDEFYSQLTMGQLLCVLDDKISWLPCRYANKRNLTTTIVLTSNYPLSDQYPEENEKRRIPFLKRLTGGVWEMYRAAANEEERQQKEEVFSGIRYIACQVDGKTRAYNEAGFSPCEPPVLIDESTVLVSYERLLEIKAADKNKTPSKAKKDESEEKNYNDQADYPVLDAQLPF